MGILLDITPLRTEEVMTAPSADVTVVETATAAMNVMTIVNVPPQVADILVRLATACIVVAPNSSNGILPYLVTISKSSAAHCLLVELADQKVRFEVYSADSVKFRHALSIKKNAMPLSRC